MSTVARWITRLLALVGFASLVAALGFALDGVSARPAPSTLEVTVARSVRHLLIPAGARQAANPLAADDEVLLSARAHWADHCASCHGNDGRGDTAMGRNLYPRAPDMTRSATQDLSDGELFWIIENGIKLTGMPAWGRPGPEDDGESWELVHFIRRLPALPEAELIEMKRRNPVSRADLEQEMEMERFLAGEDLTPRVRAGHEHDSGHPQD